MTFSDRSDSGRPVHEVLWEIAREVTGMEVQIDGEWGGSVSAGTPVGDRLNRLANRLAEEVSSS